MNKNQSNLELNPGALMMGLMHDLWPICRSITGVGVRESLALIKQRMPLLNVNELSTGTKCGDWSVPKEWIIREGYVVDPDGKKIIDFKSSNLHVVGYSIPVDQSIELEELQKHLYSIPELPNAIPYVTSYYEENWGFCLRHDIRKSLAKGQYKVKIDSELFDGALNYGELLLPGATTDEILLSTYICHPSMANNELSGPCLTTALAVWLSSMPRKYSYRILFVPETIGAICYIANNLIDLKDNVRAGYVITCVGDERAWSFLPSRTGNTLSDNVAKHVLQHVAPEHKKYKFLDRGSDERQYCSPGVDLPIASIMRSKYGEYAEYHTSLDNLDLVTEKGMVDSFELYKKVIETIENNCYPRTKILCEPKMSDRGLRSSISKVGSNILTKTMMDLIAYSDGITSLVEISDILNVPFWDLFPLAKLLEEKNILDLNNANGAS